MKMTVQVIPVSNQDPTLVAFCLFTIDNKFQAGDIGLHFRDGEYYLLYPTKRLKNGFTHYFKPIDRAMGELMVERAAEAYRQAISSDNERDGEDVDDRCTRS